MLDAHPLVAAVVAGSANADDYARAAADAQAVEDLVAEAVALTEVTPETRIRLREIAVAVDRLVTPWRVNFGTAALVTWHDHVVRRRLHGQARSLFGAAGDLIVPPEPESLTMPTRTGGPRSLYRL